MHHVSCITYLYVFVFECTVCMYFPYMYLCAPCFSPIAPYTPSNVESSYTCGTSITVLNWDESLSRDSFYTDLQSGNHCVVQHRRDPLLLHLAGLWHAVWHECQICGCALQQQWRCTKHSYRQVRVFVFASARNWFTLWNLQGRQTHLKSVNLPLRVWKWTQGSIWVHYYTQS